MPQPLCWAQAISVRENSGLSLTIASTLITFYDQGFNNDNKCPIQTERSHQWSFECLRRPDDYCLAETCR
jgi:hypothetical protein